MLIGASTWIWTAPLRTAELDHIIAHIAALGFDLVELPIEEENGFDYGRAAALAAGHGLAVSVCAVMGPGRDLIHPDAALRRSGMDYVRHCIAAAERIGAANVAGPLYSAVGRTWQAAPDERARDIDLLVAQLGDLSRTAAASGVTLCVEPLNRFETSLLNLTGQALEVVERVDSPACKLLLDTFHMNIEEPSLGAAIRAAGPRLGHFHACENDRGAPGSGHLPWAEMAEALAAVGYAGPVVIETFTDQVKTIARAAAIWRPLASSQDALARDGLAFLRRLLA